MIDKIFDRLYLYLKTIWPLFSLKIYRLCWNILEKKKQLNIFSIFARCGHYMAWFFNYQSFSLWTDLILSIDLKEKLFLWLWMHSFFHYSFLLHRSRTNVILGLIVWGLLIYLYFLRWIIILMMLLSNLLRFFSICFKRKNFFRTL